MTKQEVIDYWWSSAKDDELTVKVLFRSRRYLHSLFFAHLVLEKYLKAHWVKDNVENTPPKIHNLVKLAKNTNLELEEEDLEFLEQFNSYQLEGRYPEYLSGINKICNRKYTKKLLEKVEILIQCLQEKMQ
jgi:HEPN domain-containing protein